MFFFTPQCMIYSNSRELKAIFGYIVGWRFFFLLELIITSGKIRKN